MITSPVVIPYHLRQYSPVFAEGVKNFGGKKIKFVNPNTDNYPRNIKYAGELHKHGVPVYHKDILQTEEGKGPPVIVCGSGNSLKDPKVLEDMWKWVDSGAIVMACKQAIKYLHEQGFKIDYGVSMDPGAHIARPEKIFKSPGTIHILASSSDPLLFDYILSSKSFPEWLTERSKEEQQKILDLDYTAWKKGEFELINTRAEQGKAMIFHSATGYKEELQLYENLFKEAACMGGGYNVVNRAVSAALFMGAAKIILAGCDCGWRKGDAFYVDGKNNRPGVEMEDCFMVEGTDAEGNKINNPDAQQWSTRPDMLASGVALAKLAKDKKEQFVILGDTLPSKLVHKTDAFLQKCASFGK